MRHLIGYVEVENASGFRRFTGQRKDDSCRKTRTELFRRYLRIDTIESALRQSGMLSNDVGPAGYLTAYKLAEENLRLGRIVVADSVNALQITRESWREVAQSTHVLLAEVEVCCSNQIEHR